jgi:hypothetical protein
MACPGLAEKSLLPTLPTSSLCELNFLGMRTLEGLAFTAAYFELGCPGAYVEICISLEMWVRQFLFQFDPCSLLMFPQGRLLML